MRVSSAGRWAALAVVVALAGCSGSGSRSTEHSQRDASKVTTSTSSSTRPPEPSTTTTPPRAAVQTPAPRAAPPPTTAPPPAFVGAVSVIDPATAARMTNVSWHPGCPVSLAGLGLVHVSFHGFDGREHVGVMAVSARWATAIVGVFHRLFDLGFPIQRMQLVDDYGGSDDLSVQANNTSAFNCRPVTGGTGFSRHAYGTAIDINPQQNPYVNADGTTEHANAQGYRNRSLQLPGMIHAGDPVVAAFSAIGWRWGGYFTGDVDYQHFDTAP